MVLSEKGEPKKVSSPQKMLEAELSDQWHTLAVLIGKSALSAYFVNFVFFALLPKVLIKNI